MFRVSSLLIVCCVFAPSLKAEDLVIFGDDSYPPVVYLDNGEVKGFIPAILKQLEPITGDHYDIRLYPWKRAYELASRSEGGVIGISYTEERAKQFDYSRPVYNDNIQVVTLQGRQFPFENLSDLKGKVIGGVIGASYGDEVDKAIANGTITMDRDIDQAGRLRKLLAGIETLKLGSQD